MLSWHGYHVIMPGLSCFHDRAIMLSWKGCHVLMMTLTFHHIFPPENTDDIAETISVVSIMTGLSFYHGMVIMLSCYHDNVIMLSWQGYHIMIKLSCYHDNMLSYFFPENFTYCSIMFNAKIQTKTLL
jgi:hypothetical protein